MEHASVKNQQKGIGIIRWRGFFKVWRCFIERKCRWINYV